MKKSQGEPLSRRKFLGAGLACGAGLKAAARAEARVMPEPDRERVERILARYGSELGKLRSAG